VGVGSSQKGSVRRNRELRKVAKRCTPQCCETAGNRMRIKARRDPRIIHLSLTWQPSRPCSCSLLPCWPRPTLRTPLARLVGRSHRRPARPALTARRGYALPRTPAEASAQLCWIRVCNLFRFQAPVDVTQRPTRMPVVNGTDHPTRVPVVVTARPTRVLPTPRSLLRAFAHQPSATSVLLPILPDGASLRSRHDSPCPCRSQPSSRRGPLADESRVRRAPPPRRMHVRRPRPPRRMHRQVAARRAQGSRQWQAAAARATPECRSSLCSADRAPTPQRAQRQPRKRGRVQRRRARAALVARAALDPASRRTVSSAALEPRAQLGGLSRLRQRQRAAAAKAAVAGGLSRLQRPGQPRLQRRRAADAVHFDFLKPTEFKHPKIPNLQVHTTKFNLKFKFNLNGTGTQAGILRLGLGALPVASWVVSLARLLTGGPSLRLSLEGPMTPGEPHWQAASLRPAWPGGPSQARCHGATRPKSKAVRVRVTRQLSLSLSVTIPPARAGLRLQLPWPQAPRSNLKGICHRRLGTVDIRPPVPALAACAVSFAGFLGIR
jgi:hypothetical protein